MQQATTVNTYTTTTTSTTSTTRFIFVVVCCLFHIVLLYRNSTGTSTNGSTASFFNGAIDPIRETNSRLSKIDVS